MLPPDAFVLTVNRSRSEGAYDPSFIQEVVAFCRPSVLTNFKLLLEQTDQERWRGVALGNSCYACIAHPPKTDYPGGYPHLAARTPERKATGYREVDVRTHEEVLVYMIAHELCHLSQYWLLHTSLHDTGRFQREAEACAYGLEKVAAWRALQTSSSAGTNGNSSGGHHISQSTTCSSPQ